MVLIKGFNADAIKMELMLRFADMSSPQTTQTIIRTVLAVIFMSLSAIASAEWVRVNSDGNDDIYYDASTIRRVGNYLRMWVMYDYKQSSIRAGALPSQSVKNEGEYDCQSERRRYSAWVEYSGRMGSGTVVYSDAKIEDWKPSVPGSIAAVMMKVVCTGSTAPTSQGQGSAVGDVKRILRLLPSATWQKLGNTTYDKTPGIMYFDSSPTSIDTKGIAGVLSKIEFSLPVRVAGGAAVFAANYFYFDCGKRKTYLSAMVYFDARGQNVDSFDVPPSEMEGDEIKPGTLAETQLRHACATFSARRDPAAPSLPTDTRKTTSSSGTGWFSDSGYVITAHHVVAGASKILLFGPDKKSISATVVVVDAANDLAVLLPKFTGSLPRGLSLNGSNPNLGAKVFTVGFPHPDVMGLSAKLTSGEVSSTTGMRDDPRILQISVPVQSGNSGGPLLNMHGEVVGIVSAKLSATQILQNTGDLTQNVNYAVKARYLQGLLADLPRRPAARITPKPGASLEDLVGLTQPAVFLILAE